MIYAFLIYNNCHSIKTKLKGLPPALRRLQALYALFLFFYQGFGCHFICYSSQRKLSDIRVTESAMTESRPPSSSALFSSPFSIIILQVPGITAVMNGICPARTARSPSLPRTIRRTTSSRNRFPSGDETVSGYVFILTSLPSAARRQSCPRTGTQTPECCRACHR